MVRLVEKPTFRRKKEFARYVSEDDRLRKNRPALTAFIDAPAEDPTKEFLSVNSLEIETSAQIADYYRQIFQRGKGIVALSVRNVEDYSEAAKKSDVQILYDESLGTWEFINRSRKPETAYTHRPVHRVKEHAGLKSPSHCGVEYVRMMNEHQRSKFARRLSVHRFRKF